MTEDDYDDSDDDLKGWFGDEDEQLRIEGLIFAGVMVVTILVSIISVYTFT